MGLISCTRQVREAAIGKAPPWARPSEARPEGPASKPPIACCVLRSVTCNVASKVIQNSGELGGTSEEHEEGIPEGRASFHAARGGPPLPMPWSSRRVGSGSDVDGFWETTVNAPRPLITQCHFGRAILGNLALSLVWPFFELPKTLRVIQNSVELTIR